MSDVQLSFIKQPESRFDLNVPLSDIMPDEYITAARPSRALVDSIRDLGVIQPVILYLNTSSDPWKYNIAAGRRRVMASRELGMPDIRAVIYDDEESVRAARVGIAENAVRSPNILSDLENIKRLQEKFPDMDLSTRDGINRLCRMTGMQYAVAQSRLKSMLLPKEFISAVFDGRFPASQLESVSKLNKPTRDALAARLAGGEKIKSSDVTEAKSNQVVQSMAMQPQLQGFDGLLGYEEIDFYGTMDDGDVFVMLLCSGKPWIRIPSSNWEQNYVLVADLVNVLKNIMDGESKEAVVDTLDSYGISYVLCEEKEDG